MRILAVGDVEEPLLHEHFRPERWQGENTIDLLISCGDLPAEYLDFLITVFRVPGYFVAGNHDMEYMTNPPPGWDNLDGRVVAHRGIRLAGFAGCMRYGNRDDPFQLTEREMARKALFMRPSLWRSRGVDLVISHAAPPICPVAYLPCRDPVGGARPCAHPDLPGHLETCPDAPDLCHHGFLTFRTVIQRYQPRFWLHGHNHLSYARTQRVHHVNTTQVINVYGHTIIDIPTPS
ncbi:MAG: metallophosphoesterase [Chloroflexota bacterium]